MSDFAKYWTERYPPPPDADQQDTSRFWEQVPYPPGSDNVDEGWELVEAAIAARNPGLAARLGIAVAP